MSADRLREAALALRIRAEMATPGPWTLEHRVVLVADDEYQTILGHFNDAGIPENEANARFVATMHPGVALALADWLDDEALRDSYLPASERVADLILGSLR